jgi:hypothetical protein
MALYNAEFFKTFNKLASKITATLHAENYEQFHQLTEQINSLITKHQYSHQLSKWSYIHDNLGPVIKDCLDDEYFKAKYSSPNTNNNYYWPNNEYMNFYDLLYLVHQYTTSSDHVNLVHLAENIQTVQFQTTLQDMPTSIATSRCHFYLDFLKKIFTPRKPLTSINTDCPICLDTKACQVGHFKCKHHVCSDCYDQLNNKCCMMCRST